jgi:hypothetical protein
LDLRAGLDDLEKRKFLTLPGLELRPLGRPAVASRYTDYAIPAPIRVRTVYIMCKITNELTARCHFVQEDVSYILHEKNNISE